MSYHPQRPFYFYLGHVSLGCFIVAALTGVLYRLGGLLSATGLTIVVMALYRSNKRRSTIWIWPVLLLALKAGLQGIASVIPSGSWMSDHGFNFISSCVTAGSLHSNDDYRRYLS